MGYVLTASVGSLRQTWRGVGSCLYIPRSVEFPPMWRVVCKGLRQIITMQTRHEFLWRLEGAIRCRPKGYLSLAGIPDTHPCRWWCVCKPRLNSCNLYSAQFNHFDLKCDDECEYFFRKKFADMCWHNKTRCCSCGNCWDGFSQWLCYKELWVDSDEYESSDEDVFSPKPRSVSPDSSKP